MKDEKVLHGSSGATGGYDCPPQFFGNINATNPGTFNVVLGYSAGYSCTTGSHSTFIGCSVLPNEVTVKQTARPLIVLPGCSCANCSPDLPEVDEGRPISAFRRVGEDLYVHCPGAMRTGCLYLPPNIPFDFNDIRVHNSVHDSIWLDVPAAQIEKAKKFLEAQFLKGRPNPFEFRMPSMLGDAL